MYFKYKMPHQIFTALWIWLKWAQAYKLGYFALSPLKISRCISNESQASPHDKQSLVKCSLCPPLDHFFLHQLHSMPFHPLDTPTLLLFPQCLPFHHPCIGSFMSLIFAFLREFLWPNWRSPFPDDCHLTLWYSVALLILWWRYVFTYLQGDQVMSHPE